MICAACKACSGVPPWAMIRSRTRATQRPAYGELTVSKLLGILLSLLYGYSSNRKSQTINRQSTGRFVLFQIHNAYERQIPIIFIEIESEPEHEFVWNIE